MYEELVKRLRDGEHEIDCSLCDRDCCYPSGKVHGKCIIIDAADAIEELRKRETPMKITEIHVDEYYCPACGAENNCDQGHVQDAYCPACGQRLFPEPPKEV